MAVATHSDENARRPGALDPREQLSALVDGEAESSAFEDACDRWRLESHLRDDWHVYQLIGDVMRSDELATSGAGPDRFMRGFSARLEAEPVVLAPMASAAAAGRPARGQRLRLRAWRTSFAVAAGVFAVGGLAWMLNPALLPGGAGASLASAGGGTSVAGGSTLAARPAGDTPAGNGFVIRNQQLDNFLAAHHQMAGGGLLGAVGELQPASATTPLNPSRP